MSEDKDVGPDLIAGVAVSKIPEGTMHAGSLDGEPVLLVNVGGKFCAVAGKCTHLDGPLKDGMLVDGQIYCPWHHARFSAATGEALAAPALDPLETFQVSQRDGKIFVARHGQGAKRTSPKVVIIGSGAAGHACAEMLARHGVGAGVTVISDDIDPPYDRTLCSKDYLSGLSERKDCRLSTADLYRKNGSLTRIHARASAIHRSAKEIELEDGKRIAFDVLVLATGAEPIHPDIPGFDRPNVHVLRTLRDADAIVKAAGTAKKAAILGASFIGLEAAASLTDRNVKVAVIAPDSIPLEKIVGAKTGKMIRSIHEKNGVRFHLQRKAASFDGKVVTLDDGSEIEADFVVVGVGVKPRVDLAKQAGLKMASEKKGGGIIVNAHLESSTPGIYAVGDIANYPDRYAGRSIRVEHWVHAQRQGQHVARLLTGKTGEFADLPFFWSAHFDTTLQYLGYASKIKRSTFSGSIADQEFTIRYTGEDGDKAVLICNQDLPAMEIEVEWESSVKPSGKKQRRGG